jgi:uncharacterized membrane protein YsdA (DUF1294 family)
MLFFERFLLSYLLVVNTGALLLMWQDKRKARKGAYRIPEKTLFMLALAGGSAGAFLGMRLFRHKTRHTKFRVGFSLILVIHFLIVAIIYGIIPFREIVSYK